MLSISILTNYIRTYYYTSLAESIDTHFDKPKKKPKNRSI